MSVTISPVNTLTHPLIRRLVKLGLDGREFVIVGSGPLLAHGILHDISDLDIIARGATWDRVRRLPGGIPGTGTITGAPVVSFYSGSIQFSEKWFGSLSTDTLIDRSSVIGGIRFASLFDVLHYKRALKREKDKDHIQDVERFLKESK